VALAAAAVGAVGAGIFFKTEIQQQWQEVWETWSEPIKPDLLPPPPPMPPGMATMRTLVVDLDTVVNFEWGRSHGWRVYKRPGLKEFLDYLGQGGLYEIVCFSVSPAMSVDIVMEKVDPMMVTPHGIQKNFQHMLFQDAASWRSGNWVKDLSCLNRDMSKVILVDHDGDKDWQMQPENTIGLSVWDGDPDDTELLDLITVLESFVMPQPGTTDVRPYVMELRDRPEGMPFIDRHRQLQRELR
jgi:import inner membrane translocase subunit TIM50